METAPHCAYNLTRNIALSERLVVVPDAQTPAQLLPLVLKGPGRDPKAAVWLKRPENAAEMPRLFAFDVAYLDSQQRVLATVAVGPGTPFPSLAADVASMLFLADQALARTGTVLGDTIKICTESELLLLLQGASQSKPSQAPVEFSDIQPVQSRPHLTEPLGASLIYLPSAGSPQPSEIFLRPEPPRALEPSASIDAEAEAAQYNPFSSESAAEPAPIGLQPPPEPSIQPASQPIQLPRSLRAVIQRIDEQILREGKAQEQKDAYERVSEPEESLPVQPAAPKDPDQVPAAWAEPSAGSAIAQKPQAMPELTSPAYETAAPISSELPDSLSPVQDSRSHRSAAHFTPVEAQPPSPVPGSSEDEHTRFVPSKEKLPFAARVQRWLSGESISLSGNRRRGERISHPGLFAFYWTGGAPTPNEVLNISTSGLYLRSKDLWSADTLVRMTLERQNDNLEDMDSISVLTRVVRTDDGGVAHEFVMAEVLEKLRVRDFLPEHGTNRKELEKFLTLR